MIQGKILVVNDDGYDAEGIKILAKHLQKFGEVIMYAPKVEQSAKSQAITCWTYLKREEIKDRDYLCYAVEGTPADCVRLATGIHDDIALVVSGINNGFNIGIDTLYSGTVGAATDANLHGISSLAFSAPRGLVSDFEYLLDEVIEKALKLGESLGDMYCLNINFPKDPKNVLGMKLTHVGYIVDDIDMVEYNEGFRPAKYNLHYDPNDLSIDYTAQQKGYISISPLTCDKTNYTQFKKLEKEM